jgi:NHLM bacteriocin system ABC transporter peptidase/ATP-binding protein
MSLPKVCQIMADTNTAENSVNTNKSKKTKRKLKNNYCKTPTIYQMESTECGAASLAMIFAKYGKYIPLEKMRIETGVSRDGINARNMLRAARKYGFEAHGYRKDVDDLLKLKPPCIIHWNFNHFVVWEGIKHGSPYINDPALGRRKLTMEELDDSYTGIVLTFEKNDSFEKSKKKKTLLIYMKERLSGQYVGIISLILIGLLLVIPGLLIPVFSQVFIDDILMGGNKDWITGLLLMMIGTIVFRAILAWMRSDLLDKLQNKMALISAYKFLTHMLRLPMSFFDQRYSGDLANRVENNNNISEFLAGDLAETILNIFVAAFYLIMMFSYSPLLTLVGVLGVIINMISVKLSSNYLSGTAMRRQQEQGKLIGALYAGLNITSTLKASGSESEYTSRILGSYAKDIELEQKMGRFQQILGAIPVGLGEISTVIVMIIGGIMIIRGQLTAGMLVAFTSLLDLFTTPVNKLVGFMERIQTLNADLVRVDDIQKYEEDQKFSDIKKNESIKTKLSGNIELKNVSFGYNILDDPMIKNFSFKLNSGSSIAIVGASGCGKSTVSKLISGLYKPWGGQILFDDVDMNEIPAKILNISVSTVSQDIYLFTGSIRDNLTLWDKTVLDRDIVQAAKDACIHDTITQLSGAYDHMLSEGGSDLSGGQKQRLEIARALVTNPTVLIMDEATSALDPLIEKKIVDNIKRRGCTCVIVAHRLSAIRDCDEILIMDKTAQYGRHEIFNTEFRV